MKQIRYHGFDNSSNFRYPREEYNVNITPRDQTRADLIKKEWQEAEELLDPITKQWKQTPEGMVLPSL
ncbi:hypothetical protein KCU67_g9891, partial [Aureobasidium melanogenum]